MTYSEAWLEELPDLSKVGGFIRSPLGGTRYWLPLVRKWADARCLEIEWIDNSSIRVPVTSDQALEFLIELKAAENDHFTGNHARYVHPRDIAAAIELGKRYAIVAEEW